MEHNALVAEVVRQVSPRFLPTSGDIKKRLEALIERDYLERDKDARNVYNYVA
jgi:cullin 3